MLSKTQLAMIIAVLAFLILNDIIMTYQFEVRVAGSALSLLLIICILRSHQSKIFTGMAEITKEKLHIGQVASTSQYSSM